MHLHVCSSSQASKANSDRLKSQSSGARAELNYPKCLDLSDCSADGGGWVGWLEPLTRSWALDLALAAEKSTGPAMSIWTL